MFGGEYGQREARETDSADLPAPAPPRGADAGRWSGDVAPPGRVSSGHVPLAGQPVPRPAHKSNTGGSPCRTTDEVAGGTQRHGQLDREILALRHFEELSNPEAATVLVLTKTAESNRYIRAIKRLKEILSTLPGVNPASPSAVRQDR